ncbi:MAG: 1-acyl-sn-glycerol-3-phosphate acyltransferase [Paramuribaculum sp.]|nr:1-acyl-sn-glycerol-3-phosphate acyltransferase [Paramuribaculum sp.]
MSSEQDFRDIAPFDDSEFAEKMSVLVKEPGFEHAVRYVMPQVNFDDFVKTLLEIPDKRTFQTKVMYPFLEMLAKKTTSGITVSGLENIDTSKAYTYISNHRDIVLDASFLNLCFLRNDLPTSEIAIGNNLLIYNWITDLVKLNKSFIVKRNLRMIKALEAAKQLSAYIHYAITQKNESVWIAQREGRAKDSNDVTQESLVKMLALDGDGTIVRNLLPINLMPVSITYEYDPNDYLKAKEFLMKKINPEFKKSPHDDLLSMETGLLQPKGRVHFEIGNCINPAIEPLADDTDKVEVVKRVCAIIDCDIHCGYKIYPINYVAYDLLHKVETFKKEYTEEEKTDFEEYIENQLDKVGLPDLSAADRAYMKEMMLSMYANPLKNKTTASSLVCLKATGDIPVKD